MKKPRVMLLAFCFLFWFSKAQVNLVPNPSFETLVGYDPGLTQNFIWVAVPWDTIPGGWGGGNCALITSPTFSWAGGEIFYQIPRTGNYMGFMNFYQPGTTKNRGYMRSPLTQPLKQNKSYCVTSYFNLANHVRYAVDKLGLYFDDGTLACIAKNDAAFASAQILSPNGIFYADTLNWMKVQGILTASGNESHITIGNFNLPAVTNATLFDGSAQHISGDYYVDDVSVIDADLPAYAGRDTVLCPGDSVFIGRQNEIGLDCVWAMGNQKVPGAGFWVRPASTQTYMVSQNVCGLIKNDTVVVQVKPKYSGGNLSLNSNSLSVCPSDTVRLSIGNNPPVTGNYNWLPSGVFTHTTNNSAKALIPQTTDFTLNLNYLGQNGFCSFTRTANVSVNVPLYTGSASLTASPLSSCPGDSVILTLKNSPSGNLSFEWLPKTVYSHTTASDASAFPGLGNSYTLNVISPVTSGFCSFTRTISVSFSDSCFNDPQIPNIFTPNNDNINDVWTIKFPLGYSLQELRVYNRWGTLIYERNNLNFDKQAYARIGWDGRNTVGDECTAGVYFYILTYTSKSGEVKKMKGNLTLMK